MALIALIIIYVIELIYSFKKTQSIFSPPVLFTAGFLACSIISTFYWEEWDMDSLHINTFLVLSLGVILFNHATIFLIDRWDGNRFDEDNIIFDTPPFLLLLGYVLFQIIYYYLYGRELMNSTDAFSLADATSEFANTKDSDVDSVQMPAYLGYLNLIIEPISYLIYYYLANAIFNIKQETKINVVLIASTIVSFLGPMLSGSRGGSVIKLVAFAFIVYYAFVRNRGGYDLAKIPNSIKMVLLGIIIAIGLSWSAIGSLLGRESKNVASYVLAVYCGAEIKNLDIYLNSSTHYATSEKFGQETFFSLYSYANRKENRKHHTKETLDLPYLQYGGYTLGNVYTCFYMFIHDFGYIGVPAIILLMSLISGRIWSGINNSGFESIICLFIYAIMSFTLLFSFFSNKFFENINVTVLKDIVIWGIILFTMNRMGYIIDCCDDPFQENDSHNAVS